MCRYLPWSVLGAILAGLAVAAGAFAAHGLDKYFPKEYAGQTREVGGETVPAARKYADDLTFSSDAPEQLDRIRRLAGRICQEEGFAINPSKTRVLRRGRRQTVTGVVVNDTAGLSRRERRRMRAAIHRLKSASGAAPTISLPRLRGRLAYLHMLNPAQAAPLLQALGKDR